MFIELVKRLSKLDDSLKLSLNLTADGVFTIAIEGTGYENDCYYSYSSTDIVECYDKAKYFIECLSDSDMFDKLVNEISNELLEA